MDLKASVAKQFFLGNILEQNLFPYPSISEAEKETLGMVLESIDRCLEGREDTFFEYDKQAHQPEEYIQELKELGLFGVIIPEEHNGIGLSNSGYARVIQQSSRYDSSTSLTIGAHSSIGMKGLLLFGNEEQKKKYLPKLATGELIAAFCLTEPGAGSDAASVKTSAIKNPDGTWTLNGEKIWITNGALAGFYTVFAKTDSVTGAMSAFIVDRDLDGVSVGKKEDKMGIRASATNSIFFNNVKISAENLLGEEGKGFKIAMAILNNGRTGLGGGCVGAMKRVIKLAVAQASQRKQFGQAISEFRLIKEKIAQMTVDCFAAESVVHMVAHYIDSGVEDYSLEAAISKIYATEALWKTANEGLQIAGGNGFMREYPYELVVRDSRINMIFEGTNEILRLFIALSGMKEAGSYLKEIGNSAGRVFNDPIKGFGLMSDYASKKFSQLTSLGRESLEVHPALRDHADIYEIYTLALAREVEKILKKYRKDIIGQQYISKRFAEVAIDLFVGISVLSRVNTMLQSKSPEELENEISISAVFSRQARRRMNQHLRRI